MDMKQCPRCGATLPQDAALCTACMAELGEHTTIPVPKKRTLRLIPILGSAAALLLAAALMLLLSAPKERASQEIPPEQEIVQNTPEIPNEPEIPDEPESPDEPEIPDTPPDAPDIEEPVGQEEEPYVPRTFDNGTNQVVYTDGRNTFYVTSHFLCYDSPLTLPHEKSQYYSMTLSAQPASSTATQSRITILNNGRYDKVLRQLFWDRVASFQVTTSDTEGTDILRVRSSWQDKSDDTTAYQAQIGIHSYGLGRICWEFTMKNGDIIRLYTTVEVHPIVELELRPTAEEAPDLAALQAYLKTETEGLPRDNIVRVYLPAVTYEGTLRLEGAVYHIYGAGNGQRTVIRGTVIFEETPKPGCTITGIDFIGSGGFGLIAKKDVSVGSCTFTGYDIAVSWQDLAWVTLNSCTFRDNGIAMRVNNDTHPPINLPYNNTIFENNGIALQFLKLSSDNPLTFPGCRFVGNETDIENQAGVALDTNGAVFE